MEKKMISVVAGAYNEEENVREFYDRVSRVFSNELKDYEFEIIVIDNASTDHTVEVLREVLAKDRRFKAILNTRNFGHIRSAYHAIFQAKGDSIILMASDLQDPPELIPQFVKHWAEGYKVVLGQKNQSE